MDHSDELVLDFPFFFSLLKLVIAESNNEKHPDAAWWDSFSKHVVVLLSPLTNERMKNYLFCFSNGTVRCGQTFYNQHLGLQITHCSCNQSWYLLDGFMLFFHFFFPSGNTPIAVWGTHLDLIQNPQIRAKHGGKEHVNVSMTAELAISHRRGHVQGGDRG